MNPVVVPQPSGAVAPAHGLRVLAVDDDVFTSSMVAASLQGAGYAVTAVTAVRSAVVALAAQQFHAVVTDLNLGPGPSGADLLWRVHEDAPWIGLVVLTSHTAPELAIGPRATLPPGTGYLVKSELTDLRLLSAAIDGAVRGGAPASPVSSAHRAAVTPSQAEVLRLLSAGTSTSTIASGRGTSVRATEMMMHRLYEKLGLRPGTDRDPRTAAVLMWQQGRVRIR